MKKDVFMIWLKEFCSLIFTQTVQAFLLAIIMSVVIATASNGTSEEQGTAVSATGLIAIIALASIAKVELLVKKIFGVESQFGDPAMKNGAGALAGSLIAAKMAGRALNNVPKIAGGIKGATLDTRKAKANALAKKTRDLTAANGVVKRNTDIQVIGENGSGALETGKNGSTTQGNTTGATGSLKEGLDSLRRVVSENTAAMQKAGAEGKAGAGKLTQEKVNKIEDDYNKALSDINKSRRESIGKLVSGTLETASLPLGALAGGTVAAAMGDPVLKGVGVGIGATDYMAEKVVGTATAATNLVSDMRSVGKATESAVSAINKASQNILGADSKPVNTYSAAKVREKEITVKIKKDIDAGRI